MLNVFGTIEPPIKNNYFTGGPGGGGLFLLVSNILKIAGSLAGVYFIFQLIISGFMYASSSGDPKKAELAWNKIWQSMLGLIIIAFAFVLGSIIGRLVGINVTQPTLYGP